MERMSGVPECVWGKGTYHLWREYDDFEDSEKNEWVRTRCLYCGVWQLQKTSPSGDIWITYEETDCSCGGDYCAPGSCMGSSSSE